MSDPNEIPTVTAFQLQLASLLGPIREAVYMSDRGQPCMCSEQGSCYMHAQQERAEDALCWVERALTAADSLADTYGRVWAKDAKFYAWEDAMARVLSAAAVGER